MSALDELKSVVARLRAEDGCPWDREQTHASLKPECIEEAAEVIGGINVLEETGNAENLKEELGDLLLQVFMHAQIAEEKGLFTLDDVARCVTEKMIRRHPHVFEKKEMTLDQLNVQWDKIKKSEGKKEKLSHEEKFEKMQKLLESIAPEYDIK